MSKTIQEQIEVMQHFANGRGTRKIQGKNYYNYRIKEQRKPSLLDTYEVTL